jgi:hypothetical protein
MNTEMDLTFRTILTMKWCDTLLKIIIYFLFFFAFSIIAFTKITISEMIQVQSSDEVLSENLSLYVQPTGTSSFQRLSI